MTAKVKQAFPRYHRGSIGVPDPNLVRIKYNTGGIVSVDPWTASKAVDVNKTAKLFPLTEFDADLSPEHPTNQEAAVAHDLMFDEGRRSYVDNEGCLVRDEFGQPY